VRTQTEEIRKLDKQSSLRKANKQAQKKRTDVDELDQMVLGGQDGRPSNEQKEQSSEAELLRDNSSYRDFSSDIKSSPRISIKKKKTGRGAQSSVSSKRFLETVEERKSASALTMSAKSIKSKKSKRSKRSVRKMGSISSDKKSSLMGRSISHRIEDFGKVGNVSKISIENLDPTCKNKMPIDLISCDS
jgi:hypothetical protein